MNRGIIMSPKVESNAPAPATTAPAKDAAKDATPAPAFDFAKLTAAPAKEEVNTSSEPIPANIVSAVRQSLTEGRSLEFPPIPAAQVKTLVGFLRRAADADKRGMSVRTSEVDGGNVVIRFKTRAEKGTNGPKPKNADKPADATKNG